MFEDDKGHHAVVRCMAGLADRRDRPRGWPATDPVVLLSVAPWTRWWPRRSGGSAAAGVGQPHWRSGSRRREEHTQARVAATSRNLDTPAPSLPSRRRRGHREVLHRQKRAWGPEDRSPPGRERAGREDSAERRAASARCPCLRPPRPLPCNRRGAACVASRVRARRSRAPWRP